MDFEIFISPIQPEGLLVKNAKNPEEALQIALHYCWIHYPGFFLDRADPEEHLTYNGKFLSVGFPRIGVINSWQ